MKTSRLFWGSLFIGAGLLLLLLKVGYLDVDVSSFLKFWPLLLVLWGIGVLSGARGLTVVAWVLAIFLFILYAFDAGGWMHERDESSSTDQTFVQSFDTSAHHASFRFLSGAGKFSVEDTCSDLIRAETETSVGQYDFDGTTGDGGPEVRMKLTGGEGAHMSRGTNSVRVRLHPAPAWDLDFDIGAAKLTLDLVPFAVENLGINSGAGDVRVTLGDRASTSRVRIKAGVSSVSIRVPEGAGCEVNDQSALSSKHFREFNEERKGLYRTSNFESAAKKIFIKVEAGVSNITVERY